VVTEQEQASALFRAVALIREALELERRAAKMRQEAMAITKAVDFGRSPVDYEDCVQ
jgi:hypothetical protein